MQIEVYDVEVDDEVYGVELSFTQSNAAELKHEYLYWHNMPDSNVARAVITVDEAENMIEEMKEAIKIAKKENKKR